MQNEQIIDEIENFLAVSGMAPSTFGHKTAQDGKLVNRLRRGGTVTLPTAEKIRAFISAERERQQQSPPHPRAA